MKVIIPVFIGSPGDVSKERKMAEEAIHALAPRLADLFGFTLVPLMWEQFAPISSADSTHPQMAILKRIEPYSIFIGILFRRYGTLVLGSGKTGTHIEFEHALANRDRIMILSYFRDQQRKKLKKIKAKERAQMDAVLDFKSRLKEANVWIVDYQNPEEFQHRICVDVMEAALKMNLSPEPLKIKHYTNFFKFGKTSRMGANPVIITYPPITETDPGGTCMTYNWRKRLLPRVVYEDSKTIQDIEGIFRMLGREYKTHTTDSPELELAESGDRVWVCIPRNRKAWRVLEELETRRRFSFGYRKFKQESEKERYIIWKDRSGENIMIRSPMSKYLKESSRPAKSVEWRPVYGYTYARDYAVLARFKVRPGPPADEDQEFYHYFIGGIRGLGTWGVGWFLDHCPKALSTASTKASTYPRNEEDDIQILLEITYKNYHIKSVKDVSDKKKTYFTKRFSNQFIREELSKAGPFA